MPVQYGPPSRCRLFTVVTTSNNPLISQILADEFHCRECPLGTVPDPESKARCLPLPEEFLSYGDPWAVAALAVAALGAASVAFVALVFRAYSGTPVVKASGRELSSLLLLGILLSFALTPVIVAKPSPWSCALTRFFLGFCYAICYAALLCKTIRTARIFGGQQPCRLRYTSPKSQLLLAGLLVSVQASAPTPVELRDVGNGAPLIFCKERALSRGHCSHMRRRCPSFFLVV
ncbi:unnamed protein product [Ixodes persulcatus]